MGIPNRHYNTMATLEDKRLWMVILCCFLSVQWILVSRYNQGSEGQHSIVRENEALHENVHKEEYRSFATIAHKFSRGKPELSVPFYLYTNLPGYGECKSTSDGMGCGECDKVIPMMKYMEAYTNTDNPQVFVVPMDFLASLQSNSTAYFERLDEIILAVTRDRRFSRFGGTDHLFICLSGGCANVMEDLIERAHNGGMMRALWVGVENDMVVSRTLWPCPNRVLNAPENLLNVLGLTSLNGQDCGVSSMDDLALGLNSMLEKASWNADGKARWRCSSQRFNLDRKYMKGASWAGCMAVPKYKLCISYVPKCASTTAVQLVRRMIGIKNWKIEDQEGLHIFGSNGVKMIEPKDIQNYSAIMADPKWKKIAIIRDPADRFVSAYTNKIVQLRQFHRIGYQGKVVPTLDEVVDIVNARLEKSWGVDVHFMPQSHFASLRDIQYDFLAHVKHLAADLKTIFTSLDIPEKFLASGWGKAGNVSFSESTGMNVGNLTHVTERSQYFETMMRKMYAEDYALFDLR